MNICRRGSCHRSRRAETLNCRTSRNIQLPLAAKCPMNALSANVHRFTFGSGLRCVLLQYSKPDNNKKYIGLYLDHSQLRYLWCTAGHHRPSALVTLSSPICITWRHYLVINSTNSGSIRGRLNNPNR